MPVIAGVIGANAGINLIGSSKANKRAKESNNLQNQALNQQANEIARTRKLETDRQKRENEQLMNSVSNLTNVSYGTPAVMTTSDKYGDLG